MAEYLLVWSYDDPQYIDLVVCSNHQVYELKCIFEICGMQVHVAHMLQLRCEMRI